MFSSRQFSSHIQSPAQIEMTSGAGYKMSNILVCWPPSLYTKLSLHISLEINCCPSSTCPLTRMWMAGKQDSIMSQATAWITIAPKAEQRGNSNHTLDRLNQLSNGNWGKLCTGCILIYPSCKHTEILFSKKCIWKHTDIFNAEKHLYISKCLCSGFCIFITAPKVEL